LLDKKNNDARQMFESALTVSAQKREMTPLF
jgi:hypothetical protein